MKDKNPDIFRKKCLIFGVVALVILASINVWGIFYFSKGRHYSSEFLFGKFPLLSPISAIQDPEDLMVNIQPIREYLTKNYNSNPNVSIYFEALNTGANVSINKDADFFPASLLKVPLAMAVSKKIEKGVWKWSNELVLMAGDKDKLFGDLYKDPVGTRYTIEKLVNELLANSDNTAHYILLRNMEEDELSEVYEHLGLQDFFSDNGKISAKNYAVILRSLYNSTYLSKDDSEKLLNILTTSPFSDFLQRGMRKDIQFSHKIGVNKEEHVISDAGIAYFPNRPYLLVVMIKTDDEEGAKKIMEDISSRVMDYVANYNIREYGAQK